MRLLRGDQQNSPRLQLCFQPACRKATLVQIHVISEQQRVSLQCTSARKEWKNSWRSVLEGLRLLCLRCLSSSLTSFWTGEEKGWRSFGHQWSVGLRKTVPRVSRGLCSLSEETQRRSLLGTSGLSSKPQPYAEVNPTGEAS